METGGRVTRVMALCGFAMIAAACGNGSVDPAAASSAANQPASMSASSASLSSAGSQSASLPKVAGAPQQNDVVRLEVTEAGFFPATGAPSPGRRYYTVGLRGTSRSAGGQLLGASKGDDVVIDVRQFVFAQNERGCISRPEPAVPGVANVFADSMAFSPGKNTEGRLVFMVPEDTQRVRVLVAPAGTDGLAVPAGEDFEPAWPKPIHTIEDGAAMRIHVLPSPATAAGLPPAAAGRELVTLDVVVQNLSHDHGIEFQPSQQLRFIDGTGKFVMASAATKQIGCHMDDGDVIPPGQARRLMAVYEMPAGAARRLQYRGFEIEQTVVEIR
jgi:hypothetical protein